MLKLYRYVKGTDMHLRAEIQGLDNEDIISKSILVVDKLIIDCIIELIDLKSIIDLKSMKLCNIGK